LVDNRNNKQAFSFTQVDTIITTWMAEHSILLLRISIGIVFIWFGALKFSPGLSPAENLIKESIEFLPMNIFIPVLALWEVVIGIGFLTGKFMRFTILILFLHMLGAASPIVINPGAVWQTFPYALTLEGQYIFKNLVVISGALVIGATVRGGNLSANPTE